MHVVEISVDQLAERLDDGARLIDVREPDEYAAGHVPGAELIPLGTVPDQADRFRSDGTTYVVCRSGSRSRHACEYLASRGVDVANVAGGTVAWMDRGHPLERGGA